jgi:hypothetical protein
MRQMQASARWSVRLAMLLVAPLVAGPVLEQSALADDAIVLRVRGRSQLHLRDVNRRPDSKNTFRVTLQLQLSDGSQASGSEGADDRAFADRQISVQLRGSEGTIFFPDKRTGEDGMLTVEHDAVPPATYTVFAEYRGDELRDSARGIFSIDVGRQPTQLRLMVPPRLVLSEELSLRVALSSEGEPIDGEVDLVLGRKREKLTLAQGYGEKRTAARLLGKSGDKLTLAAQFAGNRLFAKSEASQELLLTSQATVTLQAPSLAASHELPQGNPLTVHGVVRDEEGPLPGELVELEALSDEVSIASESPAGKRSIGHAQTDAQGQFSIAVPKLLLPTGAALLSAHVFPRRNHIQPGRSPELTLQVLPPEPISVLYFVLPLVVTAGLWLGYVLGRRLLHWLRELWQAYQLRRVPVPTLTAESASHSSIELRLGEPGVRLTQQRRLAALSLRRAVDHVIDGLVVDATFGVPVAATIAVFADGSDGHEPQHTVISQASGAFTTPTLNAGRYQLRISAPGYLSQQFLATLPHRGEYRQVTVRLEPLRTRLLAEWRRVAEGLSGETLTTQTPRELCERLGPGKPRTLEEPSQRRLTTLTELVESAYYSPRICTPEMLLQAAQLADAILLSEKTASTTKAPDLRAPGAPRPLIQQPRT